METQHTDYKNKLILIVDDDEDYLLQMKLNVERMGFSTITADSQAEAEEIIAKTKPALCIFDLMMEKEDSGFVLCYRVKKKYPDVPIIIASAVGAETGLAFDVNTESERSWIKADLFLEKGIRYDQLHREIINLLKL